MIYPKWLSFDICSHFPVLSFTDAIVKYNTLRSSRAAGGKFSERKQALEDQYFKRKVQLSIFSHHNSNITADKIQICREGVENISTLYNVDP